MIVVVAVAVVELIVVGFGSVVCDDVWPTFVLTMLFHLGVVVMINAYFVDSHDVTMPNWSSLYWMV